MAIRRIYGEGTQLAPGDNTTYLGNSLRDRNVLQSGSLLVKDSKYGISRLRRRYKVRVDLVERFEPQPGDLDFRYKGLTYVDHDIEEGETHAIISVNFNGFRNGQRERKYETVFTSQFQEITISNGAGTEVTLIYVCQIATTTYAAIERPPDDAAFAVVPDDKIRVHAVKSASVIALTDVANSTAEAEDLYKLQTKLERPTFDRSPEGELWMCREVVQKLYVQQSIDFRS